jgi:putative ABC transport system permease protein
MLKLKQDLRISFRQWRRSPAFTAAAILALGLGIGATVAMFSVVDAVILRPLPIHEPDRVVRIWETTPEGDDFSVAASNYLDFRAGSGTLEELAAYRAAPLNLTGDGRPTRLDAVASTHTLFRLLGAEPILGRSFTAEEDAPGGDRRVIVLSHDVWQARYAGAPDIVGRTITADGESYTVIGVMAPGFRYPGTDAWVPLAPDPHHNRSDHWLDVVGRLRPGATVGAAEAELAAISRRIAIDHPEVAGWGVRASTLSEAIVGADFRLAALVLFAAVGLLLLIACANVANLLLARAATRRVEMAVRTAIGASRTRLLQQLLTESAVLGLAGAAVGLILAYLAVDLLRIADPSLLPRMEEVRIGGRVVLFAVSLGMLTSLLFGTAPALAATRRPAGEVVRQSERAGARGGRFRDSLVVVQVALAVTLLVGAGLMIQSFQRLQGVDPGFTAENVYTVPLQLPASDYREPWQKVVFVSSVVDRLESDPRVISAGATAIDPFSEWNLVNDVTPEERAAEVGSGGYLQAGWRVVTPGFFSTMEVPLIQGRVFTDADRWDGPRQVVITRSLAERLWPGGDPVGRRIFWGGTDGQPLAVMGVVGDVQDVRPGETPTPLIFLPHNQLPWPMMTLGRQDGGRPGRDSGGDPTGDLGTRCEHAGPRGGATLPEPVAGGGGARHQHAGDDRLRRDRTGARIPRTVRASVLPQVPRRLDGHDPARWQVTGTQRHQSQPEGHRSDGERIERGNPNQEAAQRVAREIDPGNPKQETEGDQDRSLPHHQAENPPVLRAQREPHRQLVPAAVHRARRPRRRAPSPPAAGRRARSRRSGRR